MSNGFWCKRQIPSSWVLSFLLTKHKTIDTQDTTSCGRTGSQLINDSLAVIWQELIGLAHLIPLFLDGSFGSCFPHVLDEHHIPGKLQGSGRIESHFESIERTPDLKPVLFAFDHAFKTILTESMTANSQQSWWIIIKISFLAWRALKFLHRFIIFYFWVQNKQLYHKYTEINLLRGSLRKPQFLQNYLVCNNL